MFVESRTNKNGKLISYRLFCSGKDFYTGKYKKYTKTWKVPKGLTNKEIDKQLKRVEIEFEEEVEKLSHGINPIEEVIMFSDFANKFLENILKRNATSYSFYSRVKDNLRVILPFFQQYQLKHINPTLVQNFYDYLCSRTRIKQIVVVKKSIATLIKERKLIKYEVANAVGINRLTLRLASNVGEQVNLKTAKAICKYFNVPLNSYFEVKNIETQYSKATNAGIRTTLVMILGEAKRMRLVEHNYATKEFTKVVSGVVNKKEIFNEEEAREFVQLVLKESDLRKKVVLSLLIFESLRRSEVAGLTWNDIDFTKNTLSVNRNSLYVRGFGVVEKCPKTQNSKRTISMPNTLISILKEYKEWWDLRKSELGDLWCNSNRLLLQDNGKPINPCTITQWVSNFENTHGLKHVSPHLLRRTSITLLINSGVPIKVVSERAGHSNCDITVDINNRHKSKEKLENWSKIKVRFA